MRTVFVTTLAVCFGVAAFYGIRMFGMLHTLIFFMVLSFMLAIIASIWR